MLLDVTSEVCSYTKRKPRHFEMWWENKDVDVAVCRKRERESYLGFGNRVRMRKIGRNIVRQKKILREKYIWLCIINLKRQWRRMVVSCIELPNRELGRRMLLS